jgi:hypothetical protein
MLNNNIDNSGNDYTRRSFQNDIDSVENFIEKEKTGQEHDKNINKERENKGAKIVSLFRKSRPLYIILLCLFLLFLLLITLLISIKIDNRRKLISQKKCIENLVDIATDLRKGIEPSEVLVCPASGEKYIIIEDEKGNSQVYCPTPKQHSIKAIRITEKRLIPEIIK